MKKPRLAIVVALAVGLLLQGPVSSVAQTCSLLTDSSGDCSQETPQTSGPETSSLKQDPCNPEKDGACASDREPGSTDSAYRLFLPFIAKPGFHPVTPPFGLNSGGTGAALPDGRQFARDRAYLSTNGAGYIGGSATTVELEWEDIAGTVDDAVYRSARTGVSEYRIDLPNGDYLVELRVAEIRKHGAGLRQFSVLIEDRPAIVDLDLYTLVQHDYGVTFRFAARVLDRQLNVVFVPTTGEPLVNAVWIAARAPDNQPPPAPTQTNVVGGYREALVRWQASLADDVSGYYVYKSQSAGGPYVLAVPESTPVTRFFDRDVTVGQEYCYRISSVDVYGNQSARSPASCARIVDYSATNLPVFHLSIEADDLFTLNLDPRANVEVPGVLQQGNQTVEVEAEYRGRSSQFSNKKSWKLVASEPFAYSGQETLLLNGAGNDPASVRDKLSYDLFAVAGIAPLQASFVDLDLNGRFMGLHTQLENPDASFLQRTGRDPDGDVFKCADGLDVQPDCSNEVVGNRNLESLYDFAAVVNRTPDSEFAATIADVLDVREYLDYLAVEAFIADQDSTYQYLLVRPSQPDRWQVLPWDNDVSFFNYRQPLDYGSAANPGWNGQQVNHLLTRVLDVPQYRRYYGDRILSLIDGPMSSAAMASRLDQISDQVWFDLERDVWKMNREDNDFARQMLDWIEIFVNRRTDFLRTAVPDYVPAQTTYLAINEAMSRNISTLIDPADGRADPWFEIFNAGVEPVDLGGMYVSDNPALPKRFRFASGVVVPALGGLVIWADGQPQQGNNHVNFTLYGNGGQLTLTAADGVTPLDTLTIPSLPADVSQARFPDQSGPGRLFTRPSPGEPNRLQAPEITDVLHSPDYPQAADPVTVRARLVDDGHVVRAELTYIVADLSTTVAMYDDGQHDDDARNDGLYAGQIPALPDGTVVKYYVTATDDDGRIAYHPFAAPALTHDYRVGFTPPPVAISEFMADNETTIEDPDEPGEYPDWIEVTNLTQQPVNLGGYYLTDKLTTPTKYRIPSGTSIAAGQSVIFWADDDGTQGPFHTNFKLSTDGESVGLFDPDGVTPITAFEFGPQLTDVSYGVCPLPDGRWEFHYLPTPGAANACGRLYLPSAPVH